MVTYPHNTPAGRPSEFEKLTADIGLGLDLLDRQRAAARLEKRERAQNAQDRRNDAMVKALAVQSEKLLRSAPKRDRAAESIDAKAATARLVAEIRRRASEAVAAGKLSGIEAGKIEAKIGQILGMLA